MAQDPLDAVKESLEANVSNGRLTFIHSTSKASQILVAWQRATGRESIELDLISGTGGDPFLLKDDQIELEGHIAELFNGVSNQLIKATFFILRGSNNNGTLECFVTAHLPETWTIAQTFPDLPPAVDYTKAMIGSGKPLLERLKISDVTVVLSSASQELVFETRRPPDERDVSNNEQCVQQGPNFLAKTGFDGALGIIGELVDEPGPFPVTIRFDQDNSTLVAQSALQFEVKLGPISLLLQEANIVSSTDRHAPDAFSNAHMKAELAIGNPDHQTILKLKSSIPAGVNSINVQGAFDHVSLPSLVDLASLVGDDTLASSLPSSMKDLGAITLDSFVFGLIPSKAILTSFQFGIKTDAKWDVLPGVFAIEKMACRWDISSPLKKPTTSMTAKGVVDIGGVDIEVSYSSQGNRIYGGLAPHQTIDLQNVIEQIIPGIDLFPQLTLTQFGVSVDVDYGDWQITAGVEQDWTFQLPLSSFTLQRSAFDVQKVGDKISATLCSTFRVADVDIILLGSGKPGQGTGWQLQGGVEQTIALQTLIDDLANKFHTDTNIPDVISSLEFKHLRVVIDTATKDFSFSGEVDFKVHDKPVALELIVEISHQKDGFAEKQFKGTIKLGDNSLDVIFVGSEVRHAGNKKKISSLAATYESTGDNPPGILDLIPAPAGFPIPDIKIREAIVVHQSTKQTKNSQKNKGKWLFGINLDGGLDLSNIKLPDLPLVSSAGPPRSLKLDLQVLYPTKKFEDYEVNLINSPLAPSNAVEGPAFKTQLQMDDKTVSLNLPIKMTKNKEKPFKENPQISPSTPPELPGGENTIAVSRDDTKWVKIQKNFGPVHVEKVGVKFNSGALYVLLDGGLTASGFTVSLEGLGIDTPLSEFDPHFHLSGIGIEYKSDCVTLGGAFLKQDLTDPSTDEHYTGYSGEAVLQTDELALSAIGSYMKYQGESSLFIYALLEYPLGGPPFFFVSGLAAGFGYNRRAVVPPVSQIHTYPLVAKAIAGPPAKGSAKPNLAHELEALSAFIPPELGEVFLTLGVKFTSFDLVDSFGLIIAQFGNHEQFDVVGVSHLQIPSKEAGGKPGSLLAEIYMNWKAIIRPDEGVVGLKADLVPGSYVFSQDCHMTGGFAYYAWFTGDHAGDFVYTAGGYNPEFHRPSHYPTVAPLSFNWIIKQANLHLKGQLYYALTGHAIMAGGKLDASIHGGFDIGIAGVDYRADLHIGANILITWQPYHYDASVEIDLNVDLSAHLLFFSKHFSLDVGADIHIWGPEFAGVAHIHLKVWKISHTFDVEFGHGPPRLRPISWKKFSQAFLPKSKTGVQTVCGISVKKGLIRQSNDRWIINAKDFSLVTDSVIPSDGAKWLKDEPITSKDLEYEATKIDVSLASPDFGIAPMGVEPSELVATHGILIHRDGEIANKLFRCEPVLKNVPAAMWAKPRFVDEDTREFLKKPEVDPERLIKDVLGGLEVLPAKQLEPLETLPVDRRELRYETYPITQAYQWQNIPEFKGKTLMEWDDIDATILKQTKTYNHNEESFSVSKIRAQILDELGLGHEKIHFGQPLKQHMLDKPQVELREGELHV